MGQLYLELLPADIVNLLAVWLDYPTTLTFCRSGRRLNSLCGTGVLWETKISHELGFKPEQYLPTLVSLNEKYIELKSIHGVDIGLQRDPFFGGSEYFLDPYQFVGRAARLPDPIDRKNILEFYYQNYRIFFRTQIDQYKPFEIYELILSGLQFRGDDELYNIFYKRFIDQYPYTRDESYTGGFIGSGIAEKGHIEPLEIFLDENSYALQSNITKGVTRSGNIDLLEWWLSQDSNIFNSYSIDILQQSALFSRIVLLKYILLKYRTQLRFTEQGFYMGDSYGIRSIKDFVNYLVKNNDSKNVIGILEILFSLDINFKNTYSRDILTSAVEAGSFELVNYIKQLSNGQLSKIIDMRVLLHYSIIRNHVDMYAYIHRNIKTTPHIFESDQYNISVTTIETLLKNNMISKDNVPLLINGSIVISPENKKIINNILQKY